MSGEGKVSPELWRALEFSVCVSALKFVKEHRPHLVEWLEQRVATAQKALWEVEGK